MEDPIFNRMLEGTYGKLEEPPVMTHRSQGKAAVSQGSHELIVENDMKLQVPWPWVFLGSKCLHLKEKSEEHAFNQDVRLGPQVGKYLLTLSRPALCCSTLTF